MNSFLRSVCLLVFCLLLVLVSVSDIRYRRIPDKYIIIIGIIGIVSIPFFLELSFFGRCIGAVCVAVPLLLFTTLFPGSFGGGDVKLLSVSGFVLGWRNLLVAFVTGVLLAGIYAVVTLFFLRKEKKTEFPLGPFLCTGIALAMVWGEEMICWFLK